MEHGERGAPSAPFPTLCDLRRAVFRSYQNGVPDERVSQEDFYAPSRCCNARLFENYRSDGCGRHRASQPRMPVSGRSLLRRDHAGPSPPAGPTLPPFSQLKLGRLRWPLPRAAPSASFSRRRLVGQRTAVRHDPHVGAAAHAVWRLAACRLPLRNPRAGVGYRSQGGRDPPNPVTALRWPPVERLAWASDEPWRPSTHRPAAKPRPLAVDFSADALRRGRRTVLAPAG